MLTIAWCVVLAFMPVVFLWGIPAALGHLGQPHRVSRRFARCGTALSPAIERLGYDLHRLAADYDRTEHANQPNKAARLRATSIAYDDLLVAAASALDVPAPPRSGHELFDPIDRLTVEAELARAGLSW
jgi:hypothetical protein